jgi:hypothetical protein
MTDYWQITQPASGMRRVPYVRACRLSRSGGVLSGMTCNISVLGVFVTVDPIPELGERVQVRFPLPGNETPVEFDALVTWRNTRQEHKVHSLPTGCGLRLLATTPEQQKRIETLVNEYKPPIRASGRRK